MQEKKKTKERLQKRAKYEAPQVWCLPMETEEIMAGSKTVGFVGGTGGGGNIANQTGEDYFGGPLPNVSTGNDTNTQTGETYW